jgi:hypothetical protein
MCVPAGSDLPALVGGSCVSGMARMPEVTGVAGVTEVTRMPRVSTVRDPENSLADQTESANEKQCFKNAEHNRPALYGTTPSPV